MDPETVLREVWDVDLVSSSVEHGGCLKAECIKGPWHGQVGMDRWARTGGHGQVCTDRWTAGRCMNDAVPSDTSMTS